MIKVPPIGTVTTKWQQRAAAATNEYRTGVQGAGQDWQTGVDNAEDDWVAGVNSAAGAHAYKNNVGGKAGHYVDKAVNLGAGRYGPGVQAATGAFTTGMGKVLGVISGITLPGRGPTGSNGGRATMVADILHQAKMQGQL